MATTSQTQTDKPPLSIAVVAVVLVLAIALMIGMGYHYLAPSTPTLAQKLDLNQHPIPTWVTQDAQQCKGDISKLSPQEQQKISAAYPGQGARIIVMAAYAQSQ